MKNLFDRSDIDTATITVMFNPICSMGFKNIREEYWTMYEAGNTANIEICAEGYKISKRDIWLALFPCEHDHYVNADLLPFMGNGHINIFIETLFIATGLHFINDRITNIIKQIVTAIESGLLPEGELAGEAVTLHGGNPEYCFVIIYKGTSKYLRIYSISKQGYIDVAA